MKTAPWIIIIVLILVLVIQRECHRCPDCPEPEASTHTTIVPGDSVPVPKPVVIIKPGKVVYDTMWQYYPVDTAAILADYHAHRFGNDTAVNDSSVMVSLAWHVHRNRLQSVQAFVQNRRAVEIHHHTTIIREIEQPHGRVFAGLGFGRSPEQFGLAPGLGYLSKRQNFYTLNYDVLNKDIYFSMYFPLWPSGR